MQFYREDQKFECADLWIYQHRERDVQDARAGRNGGRYDGRIDDRVDTTDSPYLHSSLFILQSSSQY